ncbi:putative ATP-dependent RNA helicase DHX35 [Cyphellophora attinorum]|uniref:RNA helicase n=1 Tax=Cyphellophora attinorum TaxID=1664694 RepID=A0A0N1H6H5_9EURO|nr:putative ATP-dependent RNA helicase DHX35 [Phialophora attinorum]KPI41650.1 putative ATP-dependent RNA helicase DHX35 [Phialophora attinorum]
MDTGEILDFLQKPAALLPITQHRDSILYTIETTHVTIIVGETGSGKTTQIPQFLEQAGWCNDGKVIAITQPRRLAATSVAARVASEMRTSLGDRVGYSIRFEDLTSATTRIKFLTDGMLLREALVDPLLSRYSVVMVDEAHERSLSSDVLLGLLKKIKKKRPELRIIISSATLDAHQVAAFFEDEEAPVESKTSKQCQIVKIDGRSYPVDVMYSTKPVEDYVEAAVNTAFDIHTSERGLGDILVFLAGRAEIDSAIQKLSERAATLPPNGLALQPIPLYAGLTTAEQMYAFSPAAERTRKCVIATNIAEASVTVPGIVYVIDCGFVKLRTYSPVTGIDALTVAPVSQASATQRAGRAGRTQPGKCFRLYTRAAYSSLAATTSPEIQRSNLAPLVLQLKALGIDNVARFPFLSPPPAQLMIRAMELLFSLGAVDDYAKLTHPMGTRMAELAVPPMMAKCLLAASDPKHFDCQSELLAIAAMTSIQGDVWFHHEGQKKAMEMSRRKFAAEEGDHLTLLNVYQAFVTKGKKEAQWSRNNHLNHKSMTRAVSIRAQLRRYLERLGLPVDDASTSTSTSRTSGADKTRAILKCLTTGFFSQAARMQPDGTFKTFSGGVTLHAHPTSLMFNRKADYVIFNELLESGDKVFIKNISKIEKSWLLELSGGYYKT